MPMIATNSPFTRTGTAHDIENGTVFQPKFDADGLIAAIATDADTGAVLMVAWMNAEALSKSIETKEAHFWSRSRGKLWKKGEDSGNVLLIEEMSTDCDQDAIVLRVTVTGKGVACHTGARSCFYRTVTLGKIDGPTISLARK
jgi:phosphoribosyl-AMP cyclohydrolase